MKNMKKVALLLAVIGMTLAGSAVAGTPANVITKSGSITTSETWAPVVTSAMVADGLAPASDLTPSGYVNVYNLQGVVYFTGGATLTVKAGTVVASYTAATQGSLVICRDAKIYIKGQQNSPVIMTSANDVRTWDGSVCTPSTGNVTAITELGDSRTGTWREACQEWGNLTILGEGLISASHYANVAVTYQDGYSASVHTNTKQPDGLNKKRMEGLTLDAPGDPKVLYGGNDDYDNSGCVEFLSLRYGGKVLELQDELNGLSLGALGRETDISFVDIMNNVDDGIEIWGGTVNLNHINIWNIGDDSLDMDEGFRGCVEYGLIVQGYSINASQGSGVGDNCFETDGAEDADAQPVSTAQVKHFTIVGQPLDGDWGCAWRDNARIQYVRCVWMDTGDRLIGFDNRDTDGANGYDGTDTNPASPPSSSDSHRNSSTDGTLSWFQTWNTTYSDWAAGSWAQVNLGDGDLYDLYERFQCCCSQYPRTLACINESVFYNCASYDEALLPEIAVVLSGPVGNPDMGNTISNSMPIQKLVRGSQVTRGGKLMVPVTMINPISTGDAYAQDAGGFAQGYNWLRGWTAADAYGMTDTSNSDMNGDDTIDLQDFSEFVEDWLLI